MKSPILASVAVLLCGCMSSPSTTAPKTSTTPGSPSAPVVLTEMDRATIEAAVRSYKLDLPATATFRTMTARRAGDGRVTACGYVNAGTGDKPYVGILGDGGYTVTALGGTREEVIAIQSECGRKGINI